MSVDRRRIPGNKDKKDERSKSKSERGTSKSRGAGCWRYGEIGHIQKDCKQTKDGEGKGKEKDFAYITESDRSNALILSLAESSESWVIDSGASFTPLSGKISFKTT